MLFQKRKIPCYVLIFDQIDIIEKSLRFIAKYADKIDISVIENPSPNTPKIKRVIEELGKEGLIKKHYLFEKNITNNAFEVVLKENLSSITKSPLMIVTDGDLTSNDPDWLEEETHILSRHSEVFACGVSLDLSNLPLKTFPDADNWVPSDMNQFDDFYECFTGVHLLMMRGKEFSDFMLWKEEQNLPYVDGAMHKYCYEVLHKKWSRTKKTKAYHLTWDLYQDKDHPYTKIKTGKSFQETWYHNDKSPFVVTSY